MILISNDLWHLKKINNFDPCNVLLAIAFVLQAHVWLHFLYAKYSDTHKTCT